MAAKQINTICVCGAGTMGSGIAQAAARAGYHTILFDVNTGMLNKSRTVIENTLQKLCDKQKINAKEKETIIKRIDFTEKVEDCTAGIIIEAIIEDKQAKIGLFNKLAAINNSDVIFATNTSSISVTEIALGVMDASRVAGMHFFNPAPVMKLVEVIKTVHTSDDVVQTIIGIALQMGKTPVVCNDSPGFIVNRVARHYYLEAMRLVEAGLADIETIDAVMEASGFKMGPFRLMDLIGIDINYSVSNIVWQALGKPERLMPSPLQKAKVDAGELGRKNGKGFYEYGKDGKES